MKLAITDACIFIELHLLRLTSHFFKMDLEIHTSVDVFNELYAEQQELLKAYEAAGKLFLHSLTDTDRIVIIKNRYPAGLSENDKTVIYLAVQQQAMVLSSDKAVRKFAKKQAIAIHGMFWIFDQLVDSSLLNKQEAIDKLRQMMLGNIIYQNNMELTQEMNTRITAWNGAFI